VIVVSQDLALQLVLVRTHISIKKSRATPLHPQGRPATHPFAWWYFSPLYCLYDLRQPGLLHFHTFGVAIPALRDRGDLRLDSPSPSSTDARVKVPLTVSARARLCAVGMGIGRDSSSAAIGYCTGATLPAESWGPAERCE
jgi:hypothetical protein